MIQLPATDLDQDAADKLKEYQDEIDILLSFELKQEKAATSFKGKNQKGNLVFDAVKKKLTEMCSGARRCMYCEDSVADEVEHIAPKNHYPGLCFCWENYLYACGPCNGPKSNKFAVFRQDTGQFEELKQPKPKKNAIKTKAFEPPAGESVLINPRKENPLDYLVLDLQGTFSFLIKEPVGTKKAIMAEYTLNEVLKLNEREYLRIARENAFENYKARLESYSSKKEKGAQQAELDRMISNLKKESHPTVWKEMQRHHKDGLLKSFDTDLDDLFLKSPEALAW